MCRSPARKAITTHNTYLHPHSPHQQAPPHAAGAAAGSAGAAGAPLTAAEACEQGLKRALEAMHDVLGHVADADQRSWCYNRIVSGLRVVGS